MSALTSDDSGRSQPERSRAGPTAGGTAAPGEVATAAAAAAAGLTDAATAAAVVGAVAAGPVAGTVAGTVAGPGGRFGAVRQHPMVRKVTGYSAGSVIAAFTSELCFAGAFGALHTGTTLASLIGFIGGAVPNYVLNRRWAWKDRDGRSRRDEILLYALVSLASFGMSAVVTGYTEHWAKHLTAAQGLRVVVVALAYLAVAGVFFVGKFVAYELVVFTKGPDARGGSRGRGGGAATRS
ncbi:MAG: GtrA family protein [Actinomycetota bacterium]|nr:GtrA family protein [Actinomycetota bacterium]